MTHTATGLDRAWKAATEPDNSELQRKRQEDFRFMLVCAAKGNMAMYELLRDRSLDIKGTHCN